jgi:predicted esterase
MAEKSLSYVHRFIPGRGVEGEATLLLLHGTGGNENDLLALGNNLLPDASLLSPRGKVLENGMPRFFRRLAVGVFDLDDLELRTEELSQFVAQAIDAYGIDHKKLIAVGYSNGANIAANILLTRPATFNSAVLFRAMVPNVPSVEPSLRQKRILLLGGERDPIIPAAETDRLAEMFQRFGACLERFTHHGGHELGSDDLAAARAWLQRAGFNSTPRAGGQ